MWVTAGILLGLVVLGAVAGLHSGPHTHAAAVVIGLVAAAWLALMAAGGNSAPVLWVLLAADLVVSAGVGVMAWSGLRAHRAASHDHPVGRLEGAEGVALRTLDPDGIVRVQGEEWSAVCVNGSVPAGGRVQVLRARGVRLEVWGEDADAPVWDRRRALDGGRLDAGSLDVGNPGEESLDEESKETST